MNNKETIKKLIKVAKQQQLIIKKLAKQLAPPQIESTKVTKTPTQLMDEALENAGIFGAEIRMVNPTAVEITNVNEEDKPNALKAIRSVNQDLVVNFA